MSDFRDHYRRTYADLGRSLTPRDGNADSRIEAGEKRLGVRLPKALRDYHRVAGREHRFNGIFDRLLAPHEWFVDAGKLVFMEENQAVVLWATTIAWMRHRTTGYDDMAIPRVKGQRREVRRMLGSPALSVQWGRSKAYRVAT
jgi:Uncharacterized conserved protein (DUF2293)